MTWVSFRNAAAEWGQADAEPDAFEWTRTPADLAWHLSNGTWQPAEHLRLIADKVAECEHRPVFLIVTMPPRHGKSELISHWTPVWFLKKWPWKRVIEVSYEQGLAQYYGGVVKDTINEHREELGFDITYDTKAKAEWRLRGYGGGMISRGVGGAITGRGGDLIIIDDPIKNDREALSQAYRDSIFRWYQATLRTRAEPGASIILLMTRWHEDDLAGRLTRWMKAQADDDEDATDEDQFRDPWEIINLPAFAEDDDPLARDEGDPLWPERFDREALLRIRNAQVDSADERQSIASSSFWWSALYQGRPVPEGGGTFKEDWWEWYDDIDDLAITQVVQVWDTAFKESQTSDRSVCVTLGEVQRRGYAVLDCYIGRPNFPGLVRNAVAMNDKWKPRRVLIEDKASGISLIQQLRRDTTIPIGAIKILPKDDKRTRAESVAGIVEARRVMLPTRAPWLADFLYELANFPRGAHDDIVDAFVHGLRTMRARIPSGGLLPEPERGASRWNT